MSGGGLDEIEDRLLAAEEDDLGPRTPLPEEWCLGDPCPNTGEPCSDVSRCWTDQRCKLRRTLTSHLAAEAGRHLAKWARDAGAEGMCAGCAFREGTRANRTGDTVIRVIECFRTGATEFMCHDGLAHGETPHEVCRGFDALRVKDAPTRPSEDER